MVKKFSGIQSFIKTYFNHFNAAVLKDAAEAWVKHMEEGKKMFLAMGGAMSTAEIGMILADMIRADLIHAISTTGANLEEDLFNLVAHEHYQRLPHYRELSATEELKLRDQGFNRVTDTCIPEEEAMRRMEKAFLEVWQECDRSGKTLFPYEVCYELIRKKKLESHYQIDPKNSWVVAACEKNLPIFTPGWEDSTIGNIIVANTIVKKIKSTAIIKSGLEQMQSLISWYRENSREKGIGFFQIGGGISGDFPICVVPLMIQDLKEKVRYWTYFCQISDSTTSYGSYSGASPNEKITWHKILPETPRFQIESDATIVAPLIFQYLLEAKNAK